MKKSILFILLVALSAVFVSWGFEGHQVVARIAENHLTPQAKAAVHDLLGNQSMEEVASWADEVRNDPEYKHTASWHFINVPAGLNYEDFRKQVIFQGKDNVYDRIKSIVHGLTEPVTSKQEKAILLKFLIHFVGDIHQPMHVSRAEDKGGNTIQLQYDGRGTNLHSLWDTRMIDQEDKSSAHLAAEIDKPGKYSSDPMLWAWESYQLSNKLYAEVKSGDQLGDQYYKDHIQLVNERLNAAGHRLADLLNGIFANYKGGLAATKEAGRERLNDPASGDPPSMKIFNLPGDDIKSYIGQNVNLAVKGKVYSHKDVGGMTLVNVGADYPDQLLTVVLKGDAREKAGALDGKTVMFVGPVIDYKGRPEIIVNDPSNIQPVVFK